MAPIKAVLRSKLDKTDNAKSLQELLVDKYEPLSDATSVVSSVDYQTTSDSEADVSDYESLLRQQQEQQQQQQPQMPMPQCSPELLSLIHRPVATGPDANAATSTIELPTDFTALHEARLQYFGHLIYQRMLQQQNLPPAEDQPLNLTCQNALKRPAPKFEAVIETQNYQVGDEQECSQDVFGSTATEPKRSCPDATAAPATHRKRKRSYRLSDNEEIRAYQFSAPELFIWNGHKPMIHQFLLKLLNNPSCSSLIRWLDRENRLFKVLHPVTVARLWQFIKGNRTDNYECFARGIRHSRDIGKYFEAHEFRKKKVYKFSEKALNPESAQMKVRLAAASAEPSISTCDALKPKLEVAPSKTQPSANYRDAGSNSEVLAKLKIALAERMQQQQQQKQQQQQREEKLLLRRASVKEEPSFDESPLVIADCEYQ
ncbi:hypothetical protein BOX15_Mlig006668g2 [Macrostomum lignano]|uniref:ETS domain-containing protein n=1 Tax=Macrostomum lignano TaxID=282301 RepID=A0A267F0N9_9PLAT|nr:hypothetical protein BOX15_Mlig006668g2 [Macrostomum lignano]